MIASLMNFYTCIIVIVKLVINLAKHVWVLVLIVLSVLMAIILYQIQKLALIHILIITFLRKRLKLLSENVKRGIMVLKLVENVKYVMRNACNVMIKAHQVVINVKRELLTNFQANAFS